MDETFVDVAEYEALKAFYTTWEELHALPKEKAYRTKALKKANELVGHRDVLRRMNRPNVLRLAS